MRRILLIALMIPLPLFAQTIILKSPTPGIGGDLCEFLDLLATIALWVGSPIIGVCIVYGGFKMVMAQGDPAEIKKARSWIINALVGLAVILASKGIVAIIFGTTRQIVDGGPLQQICPL
jgi:hypothetical protein